eukprot:NODE_817_length_1431_cov_81.154124_g677_i0.p1 GENE.NODE_817_length_1431_cov_81.154124_g677_i0~~NODE_817_length_1431_cov_81.154124_g677_i0.p1  ORF type:complete len:366 (+),score=57.11 NODE_817_length_1431_cov_81.154124_g677_i0:122-1219(+)
MIGFAIDFGWAVGECVAIPSLTHMHVPITIASLVWLVNPVVGVTAQPAIGGWMDSVQCRFGRRRVFVVAFAITGTIGIIGVMAVQWMLLSGVIGVVLFFFFFGIMDMAHDTLMIPGRTLISDVADPMGTEVYQNGHAMYSGCQSAGRLCAMGLGVIPLHGLGLFAPEDQYLSLLLLSCLVLVTGTTLASVGCGEPFSACSTAPVVFDNSLKAATGLRKSWSTGDLNYGKQRRVTLSSYARPERHQRRRRWMLELVDPVDRPNLKLSIMDVLGGNTMVMSVLMLTCAGWISMMAAAFYWTYWLGLKTQFPGTSLKLAFVSLTLQSVVALLVYESLLMVLELGPFPSGRFCCRCSTSNPSQQLTDHM